MNDLNEKEFLIRAHGSSQEREGAQGKYGTYQRKDRTLCIHSHRTETRMDLLWTSQHAPLLWGCSPSSALMFLTFATSPVVSQSHLSWVMTAPLWSSAVDVPLSLPREGSTSMGSGPLWAHNLPLHGAKITLTKFKKGNDRGDVYGIYSPTLILYISLVLHNSHIAQMQKVLAY